MVPQFELATEVRRLFESQFESHFFDGVSGEQPFLGFFQALFVEPALRRSSQVTIEVTFQLANRQVTEPGEFPDVVMCRLGQLFPPPQ